MRRDHLQRYQVGREQRRHEVSGQYCADESRCDSDRRGLGQEGHSQSPSAHPDDPQASNRGPALRDRMPRHRSQHHQRAGGRDGPYRDERSDVTAFGQSEGVGGQGGDHQTSDGENGEHRPHEAALTPGYANQIVSRTAPHTASPVSFRASRTPSGVGFSRTAATPPPSMTRTRSALLASVTS